MAIYEKKKGSDTWHWCRNRSNYPTGSNVEVSYTKPNSGELCNQCKSKDSADDCSK